MITMFLKNSTYILEVEHILGVHKVKINYLRIKKIEMNKLRSILVIY